MVGLLLVVGFFLVSAFSRFCRRGTGVSLVLSYGSFSVCSLFLVGLATHKLKDEPL
jgi:hypothetical protein